MVASLVRKKGSEILVAFTDVWVCLNYRQNNWWLSCRLFVEARAPYHYCNCWTKVVCLPLAATEHCCTDFLFMVSSSLLLINLLCFSSWRCEHFQRLNLCVTHILSSCDWILISAASQTSGNCASWWLYPSSSNCACVVLWRVADKGCIQYC